MASAEAHASLLQQLQSERLATLARSARAMERALAELAAAPPERREEAFAEAAERLWIAIIEREAMGLTLHQTFFEAYQVPADVRLRMGPRRVPGARALRRGS